jgi:hypothetical protein
MEDLVYLMKSLLELRGILTILLFAGLGGVIVTWYLYYKASSGQIEQSFQDEVIAAAEEALSIVDAAEVADEDESDVAADNCKYCGHKLPTDPEELKEGCPMCGGPIA